MCRSELYSSFCPASFEVGKYRVTINLFIKEIIVTSNNHSGKMPPSHHGNSVNFMLTLATWEQILISDVRHCGDARLQTSISAEFRGVRRVSYLMPFLPQALKLKTIVRGDAPTSLVTTGLCRKEVRLTSLKRLTALILILERTFEFFAVTKQLHV